MLIEEGKYYINASGLPIGPMVRLSPESQAKYGTEWGWRDQHGWLYKDSGECNTSALMNLVSEEPPPLYKPNLSPVVTADQLARSAELRQLRNELAAGIFRDRVSDRRGEVKSTSAEIAIAAANLFIEKLSEEGQ
jgi:hypothetical protein